MASTEGFLDLVFDEINFKPDYSPDSDDEEKENVPLVNISKKKKKQCTLYRPVSEGIKYRIFIYLYVFISLDFMPPIYYDVYTS